MNPLENADRLADLLVRGRRLPKDVREVIASASVDMQVGQVTELSFTIDDPGLQILGSKVFEKGTPVSYRNLKLQVSVVSVGGSNSAQLTVQCRPVATFALKHLRGPNVVSNTTPAAYVKSECQRAGVACVASDSRTKRRNIARDKAQKGQEYDEASYPSAWTTFQRLANEEGCVVFEAAGIVYFGKPSWLVARHPKVAVMWYPENKKEPYGIPQIRDSVDSKDIDVSVQLDISRAGSVLPGYGLSLSGFPAYSGTYFITGVNYPLAGPGTVSIAASTLRDPKMSKPSDIKVDDEDLTIDLSPNSE